MRIEPGPGEPAVGGWRSVPLADFASHLLRPLSSSARVVVAVDGRSGSGKSTLARRLADVVPDSAVVATDDVAWNSSMFGWADQLVEGVLLPFRAGEAVDVRPAAWVEHHRSGSIAVGAGARVLVVEGVGASQLPLVGLIDVPIWVQSDFVESERRGIARDVASGVNGDEVAAIAFWHRWIAAEIAFLESDRPWERAVDIVAGTSVDEVAADRIAVADGD